MGWASISGPEKDCRSELEGEYETISAKGILFSTEMPEVHKEPCGRGSCQLLRTSGSVKWQGELQRRHHAIAGQARPVNRRSDGVLESRCSCGTDRPGQAGQNGQKGQNGKLEA